MKMQAELYQELYNKISRIDCGELRTMYKNGDFPNAHLVKDINMRYRWDLYYKLPLDFRDNFRDLNDAHIYTALRRAVPRLQD